MEGFLSILILLFLLVFLFLVGFKLYLQCRLLAMHLPKPKKKHKKVVYEDDLDD